MKWKNLWALHLLYFWLYTLNLRVNLAKSVKGWTDGHWQEDGLCQQNNLLPKPSTTFKASFSSYLAKPQQGRKFKTKTKTHSLLCRSQSMCFVSACSVATFMTQSVTLVPVPVVTVAARESPRSLLPCRVIQHLLGLLTCAQCIFVKSQLELLSNLRELAHF